MAKQRPLVVVWVAPHQKGEQLAHLLNNQVDSLTQLATLATENQEEKLKSLLEWLHARHGHSGVKDLFKEVASRRRPVY